MKPTSRSAFRRIYLLLIITGGMSGFAIPAMSQSSKILTPEQRKYQAAIAQWQTARESLRRQAVAALTAEAEHEKAGECRDADTTLAAEQCLSREIETTEKNYGAFTSALRSMLGLAYPVMPGEAPVSGPTGTPPTAAEQVTEFNKIETLSKQYREQAEEAAYNQFKGGTRAPVFAAETRQKLLRLHLQELAFIYGNELSDR